MKARHCILFIAVALASLSVSYSQAPELRDQVVLNGTWSFTPEGQSKTTIVVPEFWEGAPGFKGTKRAMYERTVSVPAAWSGKRVRIEFMGVNMMCEVFVNNASVGTHIGGFVSFSFDITDRASAGQDFQLRVDVKNRNFYPYSDTVTPPTTDGLLKTLWPSGPKNLCSGIGFDVYLRAYGQVHVLDAFIKTS